MEELFSSQDRNNKDSTDILETLGTIDVKYMIKEIEDKIKATYKYLSISGNEYYWENFPDNTRKAMLGKM